MLHFSGTCRPVFRSRRGSPDSDLNNSPEEETADYAWSKMQE